MEQVAGTTHSAKNGRGPALRLELPNSVARCFAEVSGDIETATVRLKIIDEYIAAGMPNPPDNWLYERLIEARSHLAALEKAQTSVGQV